MNNEQKSKYLVKTIGNQYYGMGLDGEKSLSIQYLENSLSIGIHGLLNDGTQSSNVAKYDYKSGNIIYLTGKKCKALSRLLNKAKDALDNGKKIGSNCISSATNLIEVCDGKKFNLTEGITLVIYNNINENKTSDNFCVFQFRNDDLITDYDPTTGSYSKSSLDTDVDYFIDNLKEFAKAWCNAQAHFIKKELDFNMNRLASRQMQCMEALGIKIDTPRSSKLSWAENNGSNSGTTQNVNTNDLISQLETLD